MPLSGSGGSKSISSSDSTKIDWEEFFSEGNEPAATDDLIKKAEEAVGGTSYLMHTLSSLRSRMVVYRSELA